MAFGRHERVQFSKIYSLSCLRPSRSDEHGRIGKKGYSRVVYCNDPDNLEAVRYRGNYVSTTKYTAVNFIPKSLFEQFRRVANIYFLVVACVSFSPLAPFRASSILFPLLLVIGATMAKEGIEDWRRRKQDIKANNRKIHVYKDHSFSERKWKDLRVGDLVKVYKDEYFPADLLLLSSSYPDGICYVETMNLDGETNLKLKHAFDFTASLHDDDSFHQFKAVVKCEDPNEDLYSFVGNLCYNNNQHPLSLQQVLLRDSKLRNTEYVYGVVIFTGHDTKVMQNATDPPSKRSKIERRMDKIIYILFSTLISISFIGSIFFGIRTNRDLNHGSYQRWYLEPSRTNALYDPKRPGLAAFLHFLTGLMLYGYLIPISLYVSIEMVKVLQSIFINHDLDMYHEETNRPARARTSNLNEELGQVDTVLSDKTGTLTCNSMEFVKCSIAGDSYGRGLTEVELALAKRKNIDQLDDANNSKVSDDQTVKSSKSVKGFNFWDERIMDGQWVNEPNSDSIRKFFRVLAICHTAIPEVNKDTGELSYEAESPDEAAFVIAAKEVGFEFFQRTQTSISLHECENGKKIDRSYELLDMIEFSSARKRMSVIIRNAENQLLLLCKGADSVMFDKLSKQSQPFEDQTKNHINKYAEAGLRTLVIAYRPLDEVEYETWHEEFLAAKTSVSVDRDSLVDAAAEKIERDLILLGSTAVEDKLQKGVPECIEKLSNAGIKIWVLTGDKMETAINIGYACRLLAQGMKQIVITLDSPDIKALEKQTDRDAIAKASRESIKKQLEEGRSQLDSPKNKSSSVSFALIIDGRSLTFALEKNLEGLFLDVATDCSSVICCRSSPKQKALVTKMVKEGTRKTTLAIGDGANDVGMLQEADIGVGISGAEGMQAVMASDFAIAQFRFLERLLLVHGHWCYRRIAMMICYFFYKNITFGFTLFWFEAHASFSGQPAYNDWYMSFYNVFFTSLPVIALGVFDQDVSARLCLKYPRLYQEGVQNILFNWPRILGWMFNGVLSSMIIFFICKNSTIHQAFREDGHVIDYEILGVLMYTCVVWAVNCQMALSINYFTWIQHFFIWGSIFFWYVFLVIYGYLKPEWSTTAYQVFVEACAPSPFYWMTTFLVVASTLLPYFLYIAFQTRFHPMYHDEILRRRSEGGEVEATPGELPGNVKDKMDHLSERMKHSHREI
ncbi:putative phospholipid-transporting ATPase 8 [Bidens hawaiensis]|uniref:putative phospholipid-transporting ATPase 8 n=1 Tax=Bidens hawaiensis TaxID=980011 RepID=UPI00404B2456